MDGSNTRAVKKDLAGCISVHFGVFGAGILTQNGAGIMSETLTGDYQYHVIATSGKIQSINFRYLLISPFVGLIGRNPQTCHFLYLLCCSWSCQCGSFDSGFRKMIYLDAVDSHACHDFRLGQSLIDMFSSMSTRSQRAPHLPILLRVLQLSYPY